MPQRPACRTAAPRSVELVFFDAGGGHRAATEALVAALAARYPQWRITVTNLQETLKSADPLYLLTGHAAQDYYNAALKMGLTYGSRPFLRGLQKAIKLCAPPMEKILREHWATEDVNGARGRDLDLVVSLIPNFNGLMFRALRDARPGVPFVTLMTDLADSPPHFWQENQDQYLICGSEAGYRQALATGFYRHSRVFKTSGMILRPSFYDLPTRPRVTRAQLGLAGDRLTALVMFGGYGASVAETIVDKLNKAKLPLQSIVLCGRNEALRRALAGKKHCAAVGYTRDVADYMRIADVFIGKPGPGSMSEAWRMGLPTLIERNARTMIQERPNVAIAEALGVGLGLRSWSKIGKLLGALAEDGRLKRMRKKVARLDNQAVYEIPEILARLMEKTARDS